MRNKKIAALMAAGAALFVPGYAANASSHSDAPLIKQDPQANLTDVYAFVGKNKAGTKVLNVVVNVRPFCEPGDGVIYDRFADDALYSINIANPATGAMVSRYDFRFSAVNPHVLPGLKNPNTILSYGLGTQAGPIQTVGDARQNYTQSYTITKSSGSGSSMLGNGSPLIVAPPNVGGRTTPAYNDADGVAKSGATSYAALDDYTKQTTFNLNSGETVFCGPRDDSFYADTPGIFDLLNPRILGSTLGQGGNGVDGFKGFNVLTYAIQIPISSLSSVPGFPNVGVYASVSRQRVTLRQTDADNISSGPWIQVNRLGNPLFNEVLVALKDKDRYNRMSPTSDPSQFANYALNPELPFLINFVIFGDPTGQAPLATHGRTDLVSIFIPDVLRVNTSTDSVPLAGQPGFNRLSFIGGDTTNGVPSGWPNGRRLGDDVVDIALTAVASGPSYSSILVVGDNVDHNDAVYNGVFPYAATPHSGTRNSKDSGENIGL